MNIGNITSNNFNLDVTGKDIQIEVYEQLIEQLQQENKQLKSNWNMLKDYIVKEYYMYLPLEASTKSITILIDKMQELQGSDSNENN